MFIFFFCEIIKICKYRECDEEWYEEDRGRGISEKIQEIELSINVELGSWHQIVRRKHEIE